MLKLLIFASFSLITFLTVAQKTDTTSTKLAEIHADTLVQQYFKKAQDQFKGKYNEYRMDSLRQKRKAGLKDSMRNEFKQTKVYGTTNLAHDYGLLPALIDSSQTGPISMYSTHGDFVLQTMKLPLKLSYNYSSYQVPYGLNNYFRVGIDFNCLQQMKQERKEQAEKQFDKESLENKVQIDSLNGKMDYVQILKEYARNKLEQEKEKLHALESQKPEIKDSLHGNTQTDSLAQKKQDLLEKIAYYEAMSDSLDRIYQQFESVKEGYESNQYELEKQKREWLGKGAQYVHCQIGNYKGKIMGGFKKVNLGLSYPQSTGLSTSTIPIKGIDLEHQIGNWYTAISAGLTVNTLQYTNNQYQNQLNNTQNSFNYFDFQVLKKNQFITLIKTGYGTKENSHAFLGFRYLSAKTFQSLGGNDSAERSIGMELDLRLKTKQLKNTILDLVIGKTNQAETDNATQHKTFFATPTNSALIRLNQQFPKIKTELTATYRRIDPLVDTRNMGVMQADNERLEWQTKHRLGSRFSLAFTYRADRNNLIKQKDSTLNIKLYGTQVQLSIGRVLQIVSSLNYIELGQKATNGQRGPTQRNYLASVFASSTYQIKKMTGTLSANYSDNILTTQMGNQLFTNIGAQHNINFKKFTNTTAYNFYKTNTIDSLQAQNNIGIWSNTSKLRLKKIQLGISVRYAPDETNTNFGYGLELNYTINKYVSLNTKMEKPILGDYFNTFYLERFENFPYTINSKIIFTLN